MLLSSVFFKPAENTQHSERMQVQEDINRACPTRQQEVARGYQKGHTYLTPLQKQLKPCLKTLSQVVNIHTAMNKQITDTLRQYKRMAFGVTNRKVAKSDDGYPQKTKKNKTEKLKEHPTLLTFNLA